MITFEAEKLENKKAQDMAQDQSISNFYTEVESEKPHQKDPLKQLASNIDCLENLQGKLSFMIKEIKSIKS